jgi:cobalt-zinc-cadmium efflux system outer membrane protein
MTHRNSRTFNRLLLIVEMVALIGALRPVSAETTERIVKWKDIVKLVDSHPSVKASRYAVDAADTARDAEKSVPNPSLDGEAAYARTKDGAESAVEWGLSLSMPLTWIAERKAKISGAEADIGVAEAEVASIRKEVLSSLQTLFWDLVSAQAETAAFEELEVETRALLDLVKKQVEKGDVRQAAAIRVEIEQEAAAAVLESKRAALALVLGVKDATIVADADLNETPSVPTLDEALAKARNTHPVIAIAKAKMRSYEAAVGTQKAARIPSISIRGFAADEMDQRSFGGGATLDLPLWNWNSGRIAQAEAKLAQGKSEADLEFSAVEAHAACSASVKTAKRLGARMVPLAETAASTADKTYRLGEVSLLELIDARRTLLDARRFYLEALSKARMECNRLGALEGEDLQ